MIFSNPESWVVVHDHTMHKKDFNILENGTVVNCCAPSVFRGFYLSVGLEVGYVYPVGSVRILLVHGGTPDILQLGLVHRVIGAKNSN